MAIDFNKFLSSKTDLDTSKIDYSKFGVTDEKINTIKKQFEPEVAEKQPQQGYSVKEGIGAMFPQTSESLKKLATEKTDYSFRNPLDSLKDVWNNYFQYIGKQNANDIMRIKDVLETPYETQTVSQKLGKSAQALSSVANIAFSPITGLFNLAKSQPNSPTGKLATLAETAFSAIGETGENVVSAAINLLPISDKAKEELKPGFGELGALAGQIFIAGKLGKEKAKPEIDLIKKEKITELTKKFGEEDAKTIVNKASEIAEKRLKLAEETTSKLDFNKFVPEELKKTVEPAKANNQLLLEAKKYKTVDDFLKNVYSESPIKGVGINKITDYMVTKESLADIWNKAQSKTISELKKVIKDSQIEKQLQGKPSKVAKSIERKAVEEKMSGEFKNLAGYDPITIKDQTRRATELMGRNLEQAKRMVRGEEPIELGLRPEMLIKMMEDYAQKVNNVKLLKEIAESPLVSETSAHAQALRILAERNPDSAAIKMQEIVKERRQKMQSKQNKEVVKMVKEIKKVKPKKDAWLKFVEEIKC